MNQEWQQRTALLLDDAQRETLWKSHVMLFGLGGVGSYTAEALARIGIGHLTIVDNDVVSLSNINRQLPALHSTVGRYKTDVVAERLRDISPEMRITPIQAFYLPENPVALSADCTAVADAIDTVSAKLHLAETCANRGIPIVSCMGVGNRFDPTAIRVGDVFETQGCPLCRVMRRELRKKAVQSLQCVFSLEESVVLPREDGQKQVGSLSYVPSVAGLYLAYQITQAVLDHCYIPLIDKNCDKK